MDKKERRNLILNLAAELVCDVSSDAEAHPDHEDSWETRPVIKVQIDAIRKEHGDRIVDEVVSRVSERLMNRAFSDH